MSDPTNPQHYQGEHEPLAVIESWAPTWPAVIVFHLGNAVKYIARCGRKGTLLDDLRKARTYLDRAIAALALGSAEPEPEPEPEAKVGDHARVTGVGVTNRRYRASLGQTELRESEAPCSK